jgi:hypothetical protein
LAPSAISWNFASSMPGTRASLSSWMLVIEKPSAPFRSCTVAVVFTCCGVKPFLPRAALKAIEKQPAWAAAISSSGFVPLPSSKREANEYGPVKAPLPSAMVPLPS